MSSVTYMTNYIPWSSQAVKEGGVNLNDNRVEEDDSKSLGDSKGITWRTLFIFTTRRHAILLTVAVGFSIASALVLPFTAILFGNIFQELATLGSGKLNPPELLGNVSPHIFKLFGVGCFSWIINGLFFSCWMSFGVVQARAARELLFESCLRVKKRWVEEREDNSSVLTPRYQTQIDELQAANSQPLGYLIQAVASAVISLGVALYYCWNLTLVIIAGLPVSFAILRAISMLMTPHIKALEAQMSLASQILNQALSAIETVKLFNGEEHERNQYSSALEKAAKRSDKLAIWNGAQIGLFRFVSLLMFVQGFWYGSKIVRSSSDDGTVKNVMTTFWSCLMAAQSIELILPQLFFLEKGRVAAYSLRGAISCRDVESGEGQFASGNLQPVECRGEIEMTGVWFSYPSSNKVPSLASLTMAIPSGKTVFITGQSGSGKSTIGNLLLRLWERDGGSITIDGINAEELDVEWLRRNIMVIQQNSPLFNESIFRNVAFGSPDYESVTHKDFEDSCRRSRLDETVSLLPYSIDTIVGIGANELSGGQRQRVGIARARIRDSPVLILDESTSALDEALKDSIMAEIRQWRQGKTTIIITHDLSQIGSTDFVYVLEAGRVVQSGVRGELQRDYFGPFETLRRASIVVDNYQYMLEPIELTSPPTVFDYRLVPGQTGISPEELRAMNSAYASVPPAPVEYQAPPIFEDANSFYKQTKFSYLQPPQIDQLTYSVDAGLVLGPPVNPRDDSEQCPTDEKGADSDNIHEVEDDEKSHHQANELDVTDEMLKELDEKEECQDANMDDLEEDAVEPTPFVSILRSIWESLNVKDRLLLATAFTAAFVNALSTPAFSFCISKVLLTFFSSKDTGTEATRWSLIVLAIAFVDAASIFSMQYLLEYAGQIWIDRLRTCAFFNVLLQDRQWFDWEENKVSYLVVDLDSHGEEMRNLLARFAGYAFIGVVMMAASILWSFTECWKLTAASLLVVPSLYFMARLFCNISTKWDAKCHAENSALSAVFHETVSNLYTIRMLILERHFKQKYLNASRKVFRCGLKRAVISGFAFGISDSAILFATALVFYFGTYLVASGASTIQSVMSVFSLLLFCMSNANIIFGMIPQISNSKDSARRVLRLANLEIPESLSPTRLLQNFELDGSVQLDEVGFAYPGSPDVEVLSDISLDIQPGEFVTVVGGSGSGKSTIALLLQKMYSETSGSVCFSFCPASDISERCLRSQIASVPQRPVLFNTTIRANIFYGIPAEKIPSQVEIEAAAKAASIHDWISSLPNGYDTILRNGEASVSGGQAQRIAIARALVRKPKILILDECTASLDAESARCVANAILGMRHHPSSDMAKTTVIMITHKRELMAIADRIVTIEKGVIVDDDVYGYNRRITNEG